MSDWIEKKAALIRKQREKAEEERQLGVHETDVIYAKGLDVLQQLEAVVHTDVEVWNVNFPDDVRQRIDSVSKSIPNGFVVHRTGYPAATLHAFFDPTSISIQYSATKRRAIGEGEYNIRGLFHLKVSDEGVIYLTNRSGELFSFEDASRQLLEIVLDT